MACKKDEYIQYYTQYPCDYIDNRKKSRNSTRLSLATEVFPTNAVVWGNTKHSHFQFISRYNQMPVKILGVLFSKCSKISLFHLDLILKFKSFFLIWACRCLLICIINVINIMNSTGLSTLTTFSHFTVGEREQSYLSMYVNNMDIHFPLNHEKFLSRESLYYY